MKEMKDEVAMLQARGGGGGGGGGGGSKGAEVGGMTRANALTMVADLMGRLSVLENAIE